MRLVVVSFKQCWQDAAGRWYSYGGFPAQMDALRTLADAMTIVIVHSHARDGGMPLPADARVVGLRSPRGNDFRRKLSVVRQLGYYLKAIGREVRTADLVHTPLPGDLPLLGLLLAVGLRRPVFALYNGSWQPNAETTIMNRVTRQLMRVLARTRHVMLAVGDDAHPPAEGMEWLFASALTSAELARTEPDLHRTLHQPPRLIYAGRLSVEKGLPVLFDALRQLQDRGVTPMPELTLAGDGPERAGLEQLADDLRCTRWIRFAGQLARDELGRQLAESDLAVHPSHTEGYCKAWLDAMAQGLPVIATEVGAARAVIGAANERGWLVPPGDPSAMADAIQAALSTPIPWADLRQRCRAFAESRTLELWAQEIERATSRLSTTTRHTGAVAWAR